MLAQNAGYKLSGACYTLIERYTNINKIQSGKLAVTSRAVKTNTGVWLKLNIRLKVRFYWHCL